MKNKIIIIGVVVATVVAATILIINSSGQNQDTDTASTNSDSSVAFNDVDACALFTQTAADAVLGDGAEKGTAIPESSTDDISVSTCTYTWSPAEDSLASLQNLRSATVLVRSPRTSAGAATNVTPFNPAKAGTEEISSYGEKAFWDPEYKQLNVLKKSTWFIFTVDMGKASGGMTLDAAKKLADTIIPTF